MTLDNSDRDVVGYEMKDGRLLCAECCEVLDVEADETERSVLYYHAKAEEPCDECGIALDEDASSRRAAAEVAREAYDLEGGAFCCKGRW